VRRPYPPGVPDALEPFGLFSTSDVATAERLGHPLLGRYRLRVRDEASAPFRASLHAVAVGSVTVGYLHVSATTTLELTESADRILVVEGVSGPAATSNPSGRAAVLQPGDFPKRTCPPDTGHLVIGIERRAVLGHLRRLVGCVLDRPLVFGFELDLQAAASRRWNLAVELLLVELVEQGSLLRAGVGDRHLEEFLMSSLLYGHSSSYSELLSRRGESAEHRAVTAARCFIEANLSERLTLAGIASVAGVSTRTLQAAFRADLRTTPIAYVRSVRLDRVRAELIAPAAAATLTVTEVATRWGISHLGRFAGEYRARFGESPSATLRSAGHSG